MTNHPNASPIDYDELKREIVEAIRVVIREEADKRGISYEACYDLGLGKGSGQNKRRKCRTD